MPWVPMLTLDGGVNRDLPATSLPPGVWTDTINFRFERGALRLEAGEGDLALSPALTYKNLFPLYTDEPVLAVTDNDKWYAQIGGTRTDITRASGGDYTGGDSDIWNGAVLNGVLILTNNVDTPQAWNPISGSQKLVDLPNWPASTTCKLMRAIRNYFVAFDVTKSGTNFPTLVKWSDVTLPGAVPPSWDETDPTTDAGEFPLNSPQGGSIVDAVNFRQGLLVAHPSQLTFMEWIGGSDIFSFEPLPLRMGPRAINCIKSDGRGRLLIITSDYDLVLTDGLQAESLLKSSHLEYIRDLMKDSDFAARTRLAVDFRERRAYYYVLNSSLSTGVLLTIDLETGKIGRRGLSWKLREMQSGFVYDGGELAGELVVGCDDTAADTLFYFSPDPADKPPSAVHIERTHLAAVSATEIDPLVEKHLTQVRIEYDTFSPGSFDPDITLKVAATERFDDPVSFTSYQLDPSSDEPIIDIEPISGKFLHIRLEVENTATRRDWQISRLDLNITVGGRDGL